MVEYCSAVLKEWRRAAPVIEVEMGGERTFILPRYRDVDRFLKSPATTVQRRPGEFPEHIGNGPGAQFHKDSLPFRDRPGHSQLRNVVMRAFNPRTVKLMEGWVAEIVDRSLDALAGRATADIVESLADRIPAEVACRLLHVPLDKSGVFSRVGDLSAITSPYPVPRDMLQKADDATEFYSDFFDAHIKTLGRLDDDDLVGSLILAHSQGELTRSELFTTLIGFFIASYHTTKTSIANLIYLLAANPQQYEKLVSRPDLAEKAWDEGLRMLSPVHFVHRFVSEPIDLEGDVIEPGVRLLLGLASANRDAEQFAEPDRFDIERDSARHLAFVAGAHFCLGAPLSRLEGRLFLRGLVARFPRLELASEPRWMEDITFPFIDHLEVKLSS